MQTPLAMSRSSLTRRISPTDQRRSSLSFQSTGPPDQAWNGLELLIASPAWAHPRDTILRRESMKKLTRRREREESIRSTPTMRRRGLRTLTVSLRSKFKRLTSPLTTEAATAPQETPAISRERWRLWPKPDICSRHLKAAQPFPRSDPSQSTTTTQTLSTPTQVSKAPASTHGKTSSLTQTNSCTTKSINWWPHTMSSLKQ